MKGAELIEAWHATLRGLDKSWVLFENGTCVVFTEPEPDLIAQATALLREFWPLDDDSPLGASSATIPLSDGRGWLIAGHHSDIVTFVGAGEVTPDTPDVAIGRLGSSKRKRDVEQLRVPHVETTGMPSHRGS
jgi:hypothetical protein